jgi:transposase
MAGTPSTDVITPRQLAFIAERLPEPIRARTGRPHYTNHELLPGILRVLRSGCRWRDLDRPGHPSGVTHWRRLRFWHRGRGYRRAWRTLLNLLVQGKRLDRSLISLDGTLIPSQEFTEQTGYSGKHRSVGTKLSLLVDRAGTPIALSVAPGNYHDAPLGVLTLANIFKQLPILRDILPDAAKTAEPTLLADKGYDSLQFRQFVHAQGFQPLIPARQCIPAEQATGELYARDPALQRKRYVVERTLGWLKGFPPVALSCRPHGCLVSCLRLPGGAGALYPTPHQPVASWWAPRCAPVTRCWEPGLGSSREGLVSRPRCTRTCNVTSCSVPNIIALPV